MSLHLSSMCSPHLIIKHKGQKYHSTPKFALRYQEPDPANQEDDPIVEPDPTTQEDDPIVEQSFIIPFNNETTYNNDIFPFDGEMNFENNLGTSFGYFDYF